MRMKKTGALLLSLVLTLSLLAGCGGDGRGDLIVEEPGRGNTRTEAPTITGEDFYGCWKYEDYDIWVCIYGDGSYEWYGPDGLETGTYYVEGVELYLDDGELFYALDGEGRAIDSDGDVLYPSEPPKG